MIYEIIMEIDHSIDAILENKEVKKLRLLTII